jgi:predicted AAA+ superfamily ATPase
LRCSSTFPAVLLTGARQVGKTTLLRWLIEREAAGRRYVSLDDFGPRTLALEDPELFLQQYPAPIAIDEVQHAPMLLDRIKPVVDRLSRNGSYWLTGSQAFPLMRGVSESLAGRVAVVQLAGLSLGELRGSPFADLPFRPDRVDLSATVPQAGILDVFARIVRGSFPRLAAPDAPSSATYLDSYVQTYVERDVRSLMNIGNLAAFQRFLRLIAARTACLLNFTDLARDAGIAVNTAKDWIAMLEATHQVFILRPYYENLSKRQTKTPKLYMLDTGLACHLSGWHSAETASTGAMAGALFETLAVTEIWKSYAYRGQQPPLWFFRNREKEEIDILIAEDGLLYPIGVKLTASPGRSDLQAVFALDKAGINLGHGAIISLAPQSFPITSGVTALPLTSIE